MQDRYTGDIGDFATYGLLRALADGYRLGFAWYLYPDESHNQDGRHTDYLDHPDRWRHLDPELFDALRSIVESGRRMVQDIESSHLFADAVFSGRLLKFDGNKQDRSAQRKHWFQATLGELSGCDLVFADPDNGLRDDEAYQHGAVKHWKSIPLSEAHALSAERTAIVYHHNSRFPGGHAMEIRHWLRRLGPDSLALYWRKTSPRTFFIVHPKQEIRHRTGEFVEKWSPYFELHASSCGSTRHT